MRRGRKLEYENKRDNLNEEESLLVLD